MRCQDVGGARISAIATPTGTNFNDTGLAPTTSYSYRVKAVDAAGNVGAASTTATASTLADTTPPSAPATLTATASTSGYTIRLRWAAATDDVGVTGHRGERWAGA